jgi:glycosyltransferase involved in cell wall biosynthesis
MTTGQDFLLLTAAKNEERHIALTIESVLAQTKRPMLWVITDDGSSDGTAEIVARYAEQHPFIRLHSNRSTGQRSFGAQYRALIAAYERVRFLDFDYVGMLDADIEFEQPDYFERLFDAFARDEQLGITGGYIHERAGQRWLPRKSNSPRSVAGAVQMFRRACYEQIGGYTPLVFGGEDWLAQLQAAAAGWSVRSQTDLPVRHHRPTSSAQGRLRGLFRLGMRDASFGSHPLFEIAKCGRRAVEPPTVLGAIVRFGGYAWYACSGRKPSITADAVRLLRHQQQARLKSWLRPGQAAGLHA